MQTHDHGFDALLTERSMSILGNEASEANGVIPYTNSLSEKYRHESLTHALVDSAVKVFPTVLDDYDNDIYRHAGEAIRFFQGGILVVRLCYAQLDVEGRKLVLESGKEFESQHTIYNAPSFEQQDELSDKYRAASWAGWCLAEPTFRELISDWEPVLCKDIIEKTAYHNGIGFMVYLSTLARESIDQSPTTGMEEIEALADQIKSGAIDWDQALTEL
ncbi:MAG TPA: hypothetical protein PKB09_02705 [Candidatus Saccharibacteria bacterium]|nr:hypothetical protein [Candidatus Saccharibacteria bacterium]